MSRKVRRPNLDTVLLQAKKAGQTVRRVIFDGEGGFTLVLAEDETPATQANDVERWFQAHAD
jgi:hypothetical protein